MISLNQIRFLANTSRSWSQSINQSIDGKCQRKVIMRQNHRARDKSSTRQQLYWVHPRYVVHSHRVPLRVSSFLYPHNEWLRKNKGDFTHRIQCLPNHQTCRQGYWACGQTCWEMQCLSGRACVVVLCAALQQSNTIFWNILEQSVRVFNLILNICGLLRCHSPLIFET